MIENILPETIKVITSRYPGVVPYLRGKAALEYCKAVERDPDEPGYDEKMRIQRKIQRAIQRRLQRQFDKVKEGLEDNYQKVIVGAGVYVGDEGEEAAEFIRLYFEALLSGVTLSSADIGIYLSDGSVNEPALRVARTYVTEWLEGLDQTSQKAVREAIETFVGKPGTTVGDVIDLLEPTFGRTRAERIAVTETTRVYAEANDLYAREMQVQYPEMEVYKDWFTNRDSAVCPICGPLNLRRRKLGEAFDDAGTIFKPGDPHPG